MYGKFQHKNPIQYNLLTYFLKYNNISSVISACLNKAASYSIVYNTKQLRTTPNTLNPFNYRTLLLQLYMHCKPANDDHHHRTSHIYPPHPQRPSGQINYKDFQRCYRNNIHNLFTAHSYVANQNVYIYIYTIETRIFAVTICQAKVPDELFVWTRGNGSICVHRTRIHILIGSFVVNNINVLLKCIRVCVSVSVCLFGSKKR